MKRLQLVSVALIACGTAIHWPALTLAQQASTKKPNILVIWGR